MTRKLLEEFVEFDVPFTSKFGSGKVAYSSSCTGVNGNARVGWANAFVGRTLPLPVAISIVLVR